MPAPAGRWGFAGLKSVQHDQLVGAAGLDRPQRLVCQHRQVGGVGRPWHGALLPRHQRNHPARLRKVGAQKRHGKAEPDNRLALGFGPQFGQPAANGLLRRAAQPRAVIERPQIDDIKVH